MKYIFLIGLLLLAGCSVDVSEYDSKIGNLEGQIVVYQDMLEICNNVAPAECAACPTCSECVECTGSNSTDFLSVAEYQKLSTRIKWLNNRLNELNNTETFESLEENLTIMTTRYEFCNESLSKIKSALE